MTRDPRDSRAEVSALRPRQERIEDSVVADIVTPEDVDFAGRHSEVTRISRHGAPPAGSSREEMEELAVAEAVACPRGSFPVAAPSPPGGGRLPSRFLLPPGVSKKAAGGCL